MLELCISTFKTKLCEGNGENAESFPKFEVWEALRIKIHKRETKRKLCLHKHRQLSLFVCSGSFDFPHTFLPNERRLKVLSIVFVELRLTLFIYFVSFCLCRKSMLGGVVAAALFIFLHPQVKVDKFLIIPLLICN